VLQETCPHLIGDIIDLINKTSSNKVLTSLLSSSIDVDRMDYLVRDSYNAGVVYGSIDIQRLIKQIRIIDGELVFLEKAVNTIEDFLMARYHMFNQVYINKKVIANEQIIKGLLTRTEELIKTKDYHFETNISKIIPFFEQGNDVEIKDYIRMNDYVFIQMIEDFTYLERDQDLVYLSNAFMMQDDRCKTTKPKGDYYSFVVEKYSKKIYNETILIITEDGQIKPIEEVSTLVDFLKNTLEIKSPQVTYYLPKS
jgi:HD superfamily phosphohydrolase